MKITKTETMDLMDALRGRFSKEELAAKMGVSLRTIDHWCSGLHLPRRRDLLKLRRILSALQSV